jgi:hypothetical protein
VRPAGARPPRIAVVADDLMWGTRLLDGVRRAGAEAVPVRTAPAVDPALASADGAIVDLTARAFDPLAVIRSAAARDVPSIAVGPHDDEAVRRAAREAGAGRVHAYRALFEHGDVALAAWLARIGGDDAADEGTEGGD